MYERRNQPLMPTGAFYFRLLRHLLGALALVAGALAVGVLGYHFLAGFSWIDSLLNASMILAGMGPVNPLPSNSAKIFASGYALFAGIIFLVTAGVLFAPLFHRFLHSFHLELDDD
jgi:hypothetical protein